ncbi:MULTISPECIES: prepilin peptidase [Cupriavidus]|uniref:prepilin peptidase n=1 Tax=Cupriavidus sp. SK-3 TaxID=1470558 RepID=UPI00044952A7|nr:A24 family peptidase [Cupriavidus sp. SK-3]KDP83431.1 methyltransferase [Cupriavidus sp. SK-3]
MWLFSADGASGAISSLAAPAQTIAGLAALPPWFLVAAAALVGLLVGSFLNVVVHRLPRMIDREEANYIAELRDDPLPHPEAYNLMVPRSACPHCGHAIGVLENIPVLSYLVLRGRCSACRAPIGARYPLVEAATALLTALAAVHFGPTWQALAAIAMIWALIALTLIDADTQLLPDQITLPLLWLGLLLNLGGLFAPLADAVTGAAAGYLLLWTVYWMFKLVRGKEGMGYGDFKLMGAMGAWFGWQALPALVLLSSVVALVFALANIALRRQDRDTHFAFGPYIAGAGLLVLFFGSNVLPLGIAG